MFLGVVPEPCIAQILRVIDFGAWPEIYVCCSGTFRLERGILGKWPDARILSNDVSLYTVPLGRLAAGGQETPLKFMKDLAWVEDILAGGEYLDRVAAVILASDYAKFASGKPNRYKTSHAEHYRQNFHTLLKDTRKKVDVVLDKLSLAGFYAGDWVQHARNGMERGAGIVAFPPFFKCMAPHHRILTADFRWVPCGDLKVGDQLLAFDEYPVEGNRVRRWRFATVTHSAPAVKDCVRVHLENGEIITCTADHPWLATWYRTRPCGDRGWLRASELCRQSRYPSRDPAQIKATVLKALTPWQDPARSFDDGWMSGILDGEGTVSMPLGPKGKGASKLAVAQADGPVADRIERMLREYGFQLHIHVLEPKRHNHKRMKRIETIGGFPEVLRALGTFQPQRLIDRLKTLDIGRQSVRVNGNGGAHVRVETVEAIGPQEIQSISTSTGTYVGEGYLMHNSGYEQMFRFINENIEWDAPDYEIYDPKRLPEIVGEIDASGAPYCILSDQLLEGREPVIEFTWGRRLPHYCYANTDHSSYVRGVPKESPFTYEEVKVSRLGPDTEVKIVEAPGDWMTFLKNVYLSKTITHTPGMANYLVYLDGKLAGALIYTLPKFGDHDNIYLLSDFSLSREGRLAKLIARMALSQDIVGKLNRRYLERFTLVLTTAFAKGPVSMKYRGVMELSSRKAAEPPKQGFVLNYRGAVLPETPQDAYRWWWERYGKKAVAEAQNRDQAD